MNEAIARAQKRLAYFEMDEETVNVILYSDSQNRSNVLTWMQCAQRTANTRGNLAEH
jgi:hypothetical protein